MRKRVNGSRHYPCFIDGNIQIKKIYTNKQTVMKIEQGRIQRHDDLPECIEDRAIQRVVKMFEDFREMILKKLSLRN